MSVTRAPRYPATPARVALGAILTCALFVAIMALLGLVIAGPVGFIVALVAAAFAAAICTLFVGVPISILVSHILRRSGAAWLHIIGQLLTGAATAGVVIGIDLTSLNMPQYYALFHVAFVAGAALSAAAGWTVANVAADALKGRDDREPGRPTPP
jgi:hypothetical protein